MPTYQGGRHEHGQSFLTDHATIRRLLELVERTDGPIVEIGPGRGALTFGLQRLGRALTVVEIDPRHARWLSGRLRDDVRVVNDDFLRWPLPERPYVVVGNLPFHLTTAMLRKLLHNPTWTDAVLLVQWEVARRRAGIGGSTMMTAQWSPWVAFALEERVPASAFTPRPSVDGGLLTLSRRRAPLLDPRARGRYQAFVHAVFTGRGRGLPAILAAVCAPEQRKAVKGWLARAHLRHGTLPKDLSPEQWVALFSAAVPRGRRGDHAAARRRRP